MTKRDEITASLRVRATPRKQAPKAMREALERVRMYRKHVKAMIAISHKAMKKVGDEKWNAACDEVCGGHGGDESPIFDWLKLDSLYSAALVVARTSRAPLALVFMREVAEEMARFSERIDAVLTRAGEESLRLEKFRKTLN